MVGSSMTVEAEKHMDSEIDALFSLTLLIRDTIPLTTIHYFFGRFAWGARLQRDRVAEAKFIVHVF
jgi:hypothetical protein